MWLPWGGEATTLCQPNLWSSQKPEGSKPERPREAASKVNVSWCGGVGESQRVQLMAGMPNSLKLWAAMTWTIAWTWVAGKATGIATTSQY